MFVCFLRLDEISVCWSDLVSPTLDLENLLPANPCKNTFQSQRDLWNDGKS